MKYNITSTSVVAMVLALFTLNVTASDTPGTAFNLDEVAPGIYVHSGVHVPFEDPQHDDIANTGFIIGNDCVAVIDTGGSVRIGQQLLDSLRNITDKPVCYVINTHVHFDHVLGNVVFKSGDTKFVGHADLADAMAASSGFFIEEFREDLGEYANADGIVAPTMLVEDTLELDLGDRELQLKAWPVAHTHTDLTVLDKKTNTLWLADLLFVERIPALDGSLKGWLAVIDQLEKEPYATVIPGHGPVISDWPDGLLPQKQYLTMLLEQTRKRIAEGAFMEEVIESVGEQEKQAWLLHEQHHKRNVTKAFTELEWE